MRRIPLFCKQKNNVQDSSIHSKAVGKEESFFIGRCKRAQADSKNGYLLFLYGSPTCTDNEEYVDGKAFRSIALQLHCIVGHSFQKSTQEAAIHIAFLLYRKIRLRQSNCQDIPKTLCRLFQNSAKNRNKKSRNYAILPACVIAFDTILWYNFLTEYSTYYASNIIV